MGRENDEFVSKNTENDRLMLVFCLISIFCVAIRAFQLICITYQAIGFESSFTLTKHIFSNDVVKIPVEILIDLMIIFTTIYGGVETTISVIKTREIPIGEIKPLPDKKKRRFWHIFNIWTAQTISCTLLYGMIGKNDVTDFDLAHIYIGFLFATTVLLAGANANRVVEDVQVKMEEDDKITKENLEKFKEVAESAKEFFEK